MFYDAVLVSSLVLLGLNIGAHLLVRFFFLKNAKYIFFVNVFFVLIFLSILTVLQYLAWSRSGITASLLPPITPISYFIKYVFFRVWISYIASFIFGIIGVFAIKKFNKKRSDMLLYDNEQWIIGSSIFLSGFPGVLIYVPVFFIIFFIVSVYKTIQKGKDYRTSPHFLWFPTSLCVILFIYLFFTGESWWMVLRF